MNALRILGSTDNERGDLFTRLIRDLFFALGYDDLRLNVHKTGREIDVQGTHRLEPRRVVAECKAHDTKMGGKELNKFFGVLTREREKNVEVPITGYFVSLSGFTETAVEQELETGDDRVILLNAERVVEELERSRVVAKLAAARERAGQCLQHSGLHNAAFESAELLGHDRGYVWAIYYSQSKELTHFALIHADGTPLAEAVASEIVKVDKKCSGILDSLKYIAPPPPPRERAALAAKAVARYKQWLGEECGFIHLDGLPADGVLSATRLKLERLFVPAKAYYEPETQAQELEQKAQRKVLSIAEMLGESVHLVFLATPGGGKSTLLKRLAIAYAFPERGAEAADHLPEHNWLPLFLRCRELRDRAYRPVLEILDDLSRHACSNSEETTAFHEYVHESLRAGRVLLLVDGLDEISEEGARQVFVNHLRAFLAVFPKVGVVMSSREAGFRLVAGVVVSMCRRAKLAPFDQDDVLQLCERWHLQVVGDNEKVRSDARDLAVTIWENKRIRTLAENPLLLTTLLVVRRSIGELPRNRVALYREAVRVLIRTWNVEGYAPLEEAETLAQLSYVACAMTESGTQTIGYKALEKLLQQSRHELEPELQFVGISTTSFIERIEYRSSLLMQTGHEMSEGELQPVYEFRHLTFQEYLAARGYVEEQYPGRAEGKTLADILGPHLDHERWIEVVALSMVLAGRRAENMMRRLCDLCAQLGTQAYGRNRTRVNLLTQCLLDEVQVTAPLLRYGLAQVARLWGPGGPRGFHRFALPRGKYGTLFREVAEESFLHGGSGWDEYANVVAHVAVDQWFQSQPAHISDAVAQALLDGLKSEERIVKIRAALVCMNLAYEHQPPLARKPLKPPTPNELFGPLRGALCDILSLTDEPATLAASWALAWVATNRVCIDPIPVDSMLTLYRIWKETSSEELSRFASWALGAQPLWPRDAIDKSSWGSCDAFLVKAAKDGRRHGSRGLRQAALVVAWYRHAPWQDEELAREFEDLLDDPFYTTYEVFQNLGPLGKELYEKRISEEKERKR